MPAPETSADAELLAATERWFLARGIPHFIEDYRASENVFTRALPLLALVFLLELLGAANLEWAWWINVGALLGGVAVAVGLWAVVNAVRGRRWSQLPDTIGPVELAAFDGAEIAAARFASDGPAASSDNALPIVIVFRTAPIITRDTMNSACAARTPPSPETPP